MTTLSLARCPDCQIELQPQWKFCIACGTPVPTAKQPIPAEPVEPAEQEVPAELVAPTPAIPAQQAVPAAIRPAAGLPTGEEPRRTINVPAIVSVVLGTAGVALIIYLLVVVFGSRG